MALRSNQTPDLSTSPVGGIARSGPHERRFPYTGTVPEGAFYVERPADRILPERLAAGDYCHLLAPRQVGKSSLRLRVMKKLEAQGIRCASLDLTSIGSAATVDEWFFGLVEEVARKLGLPDPVAFWEKHRLAAPARRWATYIRSILCNELTDKRLVIMLDEIEAVRLVSFSMDDFFLTLREMFEGRGNDEALGRVSFCLIGVTTPDDLTNDKLATPFNISHRVHLSDFTRSEIEVLAPGLADHGASPSALLDGVYAWTDGHPYMTMRACAALSVRGPIAPGQEKAVVDEVIRAEFLVHPLEDPNLGYAARRYEDPKFERPEALLADKHLLLQRLLDGEKVAADLDNRAQSELWLCGMVKAVEDGEGSWLRVRNRIFGSTFDREWLQRHGDRRFLADTIRKWKEAGKNKDYLLRGAALAEAASRDPRLWTGEEREFLVQSLEDEQASWERIFTLLKSQRDVFNFSAKHLSGASEIWGKVTERLRLLVWVVALLFYGIGGWSLVLSLSRMLDHKYDYEFGAWLSYAAIFVLCGGVLSWLRKKIVAELSALVKELRELSTSMQTGSVAARERDGLIDDLDKMIATRREQLQRLSPGSSDLPPAPPSAD